MNVIHFKISKNGRRGHEMEMPVWMHTLADTYRWIVQLLELDIHPEVGTTSIALALRWGHSRSATATINTPYTNAKAIPTRFI